MESLLIKLNITQSKSSKINQCCLNILKKLKFLNSLFYCFLVITVDINVKLVLLRKNVFLYRQMAMAVICLS